jgi:protease-4
MDSKVDKNDGLTLGAVLLLIVLPLVAGLAVAMFIPRPKIGVIYLDDAIFSGSARELNAQIIYAQNHPEIKAVVLVLNTSGGTVSDSESVYRELVHLRASKPVVTLVEGMAASGGYYLASATEFIIAKASSEVGNIGVIGVLPDQPTVIEQIYSTGPYKLWGQPRETFVRELEMLKQGFLQAVVLGRGKKLKIPPEIVLRGEIYSGGEALQLGLIDAFGSTSDAYDKAAQLAKIAHYRIENLRVPAGLAEKASSSLGFFQTHEGVNTAYPSQAGVYMLYIPPSSGGVP